MLTEIVSVLSDYTFQLVALGTGIIGLLSGVIGTYATLRKESLLGDALSHAALPGIGLAFVLIQRKELLFLMMGAIVSGLIATAIVQLITKKTLVKLDSALSLVLSSFFGLGLVVLTAIQNNPNAQQAGLSSFIFGQASAMLSRDVQLIAAVGVILLALVVLFWKEFKCYTFDPMFSRSLGFSSKLIEFLLSMMIVLTIIIGLESVGVILISALLIGPSIAARQWSHRLSSVMVLSGLTGFLSGVIGTLVSSMGENIPTGPVIVVVVSLFVFGSLLFAPKQGLVARRIKKRNKQKQFLKRLNELKEGHS
ncbi:manganese/zinc/iron transport system permease protein [Alkalibacterium subtropicum]|uniref:Manganese import system permease protein ScaB n=1 Tax=Alkalibacterium subtropicum TaxID=753702 RepID=A0A1I1FHN8_9LACT|nr:iron chelate uptake ABC transporter family permease subunit [Alkalibacterium subtropicum]SFB98466.1 manganese/zinc/iron transport system permease protein [Alkalibacterium subtropicum]